MKRILIFGNSGSGKTTMATALAAELGASCLDLDTITWKAKAVRRPLPESIDALRAYLAAHEQWVIEGCYADMIEAALPHCSELRFLNPGVEACVAHCRARPWEPHKYASRAEQDELLEVLVDWVRRYETRDDEYSLARHRAIFDGFAGPKREYTGA
jgi:adenylate kinase family enzyme